jgi:TonB family protein
MDQTSGRIMMKRRTALALMPLVIATFALCVSAQNSPQQERGTYVVGNGVQAPVVLQQPLPAYTDEARAARVEGILLVQVIIRKDGTVDSFKILRSLGYGLDESAIDTIAQRWRFAPGTLNGEPVDVQANIEVSFRLNGKNAQATGPYVVGRGVGPIPEARVIQIITRADGTVDHYRILSSPQKPPLTINRGTLRIEMQDGSSSEIDLAKVKKITMTP